MAPDPRRWWQKLGWFAALWLGSVLLVLVLARAIIWVLPGAP